MTARERDPQGVSGPPADLTRIAAIRERLELGEDGTPIYLHAEDCPSFCDYACNSGRRQTRDALDALAWLLARLAPATPSDAATAADPREAEWRVPDGHCVICREDTNDAEDVLFTPHGNSVCSVCWRSIIALRGGEAKSTDAHAERDTSATCTAARSNARPSAASGASVGAPASAERSGAAPQDTADSLVLQAYKAHHARFHPECNIDGPPNPPRRSQQEWA